MANKLRDGHAPGYVRDTALAAHEPWLLGTETIPSLLSRYESDYQPHEISISPACGLVFNCTDIVPSTWFDALEEESLSDDEPAIKRRTYAACARHILEDIKMKRAARQQRPAA